MNRRSLLKGLLGLPALALTKFLPVSTSEWLVNWKPRSSDQASIALLDWAKSQEPPNLLPVVEALSRRNPLLQDVAWSEKNCRIGHRITTRNWLKESIHGN